MEGAGVEGARGANAGAGDDAAGGPPCPPGATSDARCRYDEGAAGAAAAPR